MGSDGAIVGEGVLMVRHSKSCLHEIKGNDARDPRRLLHTQYQEVVHFVALHQVVMLLQQPESCLASLVKHHLLIDTVVSGYVCCWIQLI